MMSVVKSEFIEVYSIPFLFVLQSIITTYDDDVYLPSLIPYDECSLYLSKLIFHLTDQ